MWHKLVGSCGHVAVSVRLVHPVIRVSLRTVRFSPVENLLVSIHNDFRGNNVFFKLWEVNTGGLVFRVEVRLDDAVNDCSFSRDGRQLIFRGSGSTMPVYSVSDTPQFIKVIHQSGPGGGFDAAEITADGRQVACIERGWNWCVRLWDVHLDGSTSTDIYVCQVGESVDEISISPLDDSIAMMTPWGVIRLAHRHAPDMAWTTEVLADGRFFNKYEMFFTTSGQLLATVCVDGGIEIWDPIKGKCLRKIVYGVLSEFSRTELAYSPEGSLVAVTASSDGRVFLHTI
jgi:WD40 repeat protein